MSESDEVVPTSAYSSDPDLPICSELELLPLPASPLSLYTNQALAADSLSHSDLLSVPSTLVAFRPELYPLYFGHGSETYSNRKEESTTSPSPDRLCTSPIWGSPSATPYLTGDPEIPLMRRDWNACKKYCATSAKTLSEKRSMILLHFRVVLEKGGIWWVTPRRQSQYASGYRGPRLVSFRQSGTLFQAAESMLSESEQLYAFGLLSSVKKQKRYAHETSTRYTEPSEVVCSVSQCQNDVAFPRKADPIPIGPPEMARPIHAPETQNNTSLSAEQYPRSITKHKPATISLEQLQQYFGMKLEDAAQILGVSRSTLKRRCRDVGITSWPNTKRRMSSATATDQEASQHLEAFVCQHDSQHPQPSESLAAVNILPIFTASTIEQTRFDFLEGSKRKKMERLPKEKRKNAGDSSCQGVPINPSDERMVIMKATYGEDMYRFTFSSKSGVVQLKKEVSDRTTLEIDSFNIKYWDSDQELISIACEDDLKECLNVLSSGSNNTIRRQVHEKVAK